MNKYIKIILIILLIICLVLQYQQYNCINQSVYLEHFGTNWDSNIDGIIYINLENRDDRKELVLNELTKINTDMTKVQKVSGIYTPQNGHKGCIQSHLLALLIAKMNKWNNVLILEDDFELNVDPIDFNNKINYIFDYIKDTNAKWDVVMIATAYAKKENIDNVIVKINSATTGSAYIVNNTYYDTLINLFTNCNDKMSKDKWNDDNWEPYALDQQWLPFQMKDNWFGFNIDLSKQRNIRSSTNEKY
jgi:hypothetical protein